MIDSGDDGASRSKAPAPARPSAAAHYAGPPLDRETVVAVVGSASRAGAWCPPERLTAVAGLGSVTLDFRNAELPAGETEVRAWAVLGSVRIIVPRGLDVEADGLSLLGSVEHKQKGRGVRALIRSWIGRDEPVEPPPEDEAYLTVRSTAILGSVEIEVA